MGISVRGASFIPSVELLRRGTTKMETREQERQKKIGSVDAFDSCFLTIAIHDELGSSCTKHHDLSPESLCVPILTTTHSIDFSLTICWVCDVPYTVVHNSVFRGHSEAGLGILLERDLPVYRR